MFKRSLFIPLFAIVLFVFLLHSDAQAAGSQENQSSGQVTSNEGQRQGGRWSGEQITQRHLQMLTEQLNLTSDQQSKIKSILEDEQKQFMAVRQDSSLAPQDKHAKLTELHKSTSSQIRSVLTEDQQKKFDELQAKHKEEMGKRGRRGSEPHPKD